MKKVLFILLFISAQVQLTKCQWIQQYTGAGGGGQISAVTDITAWATGNEQLVFRTTNGGDVWFNAGWKDLTGGTKHCIWAFNAYSAIVAVHSSTDSNFLYKTTNAGLNWSVKLKGQKGSTLFYTSIKFRNETDGFVVGNPFGGRHHVWKTTNAGETWDSTGLYLPSTASVELPYNNALWYSGNTVMIGAKGLGIYHSTNNGVNWALRVLPGSQTINPGAIWFKDENTGYAGGGNDLLLTTNAGVNWSIIPNTHGSRPINAILASGSTIWFTRDTEDYIFYSLDNGANWGFIDPIVITGSSVSNLFKSRSGNAVWTALHKYVFNGAP